MQIKSCAACLIISIASFISGFSGVQNDQATIRVRVDMVSMPVVVMDKDGRRITDLRQDEFRVLEDGVAQNIAGFAAVDEPISVALMLDTSDSAQQKLARIQKSAINFVNQLHPDDEVAILSFADEIVLQEDFTIDRNRNERGIRNARSGEWTKIYEAVWLALEEVLKPVKQRKALVLFTDGVDTKSWKANMEETLEQAKETRATIYVVYYNTEQEYRTRTGSGTGGQIPNIQNPYPGQKPSIGVYKPGTSPEEYRTGKNYVHYLTEYSGGEVFDGMTNLDDAFSQVARELASQYSLGYYSTNTRHDGKFRKVKIEVARPGLAVRTKKGYYSNRGK